MNVFKECEELEIAENKKHQKDYNEIYIYREFTNSSGKYEENMNITTEFDDLEKLLSFINERKRFYKKFWDMRKIEIEIVPKGEIK